MENLPTDFWVTSLQFTPKAYQTIYPAIDPTNPQNSMAGKVAIIVGASKGIGKQGIAPAFAKAGAKGLVLVARDAEKLAEVEKEVQAINPAVQTLAVPTDMADAKSVEGLFAKVKETFGHADTLVLNAVALTGTGSVIHENDAEEWWKNYEINTKGPFLVSKHFIAQLPADAKATIIGLTTFGAWGPMPFMSGYATSKLATIQLLANIAAVYPNITVVSVHPGLYDTDMLQDAFRRFDLDDPSLIGGTLVWLSADPERSKFLSGRVIVANWDVEGLVERKEEIVKEGLLVLGLTGKFGKEQFA